MLAVKIARTWWVNPNAARWLDPAEGRRAATAGATAISIPFRGAAGEWKPPLLADHLGPRDRGGEGAWRGCWKAIRNENIGFLWISARSRGLGRLVSHFCWAIYGYFQGLCYFGQANTTNIAPKTSSCRFVPSFKGRFMRDHSWAARNWLKLIPPKTNTQIWPYNAKSMWPQAVKPFSGHALQWELTGIIFTGRMLVAFPSWFGIVDLNRNSMAQPIL